VPLTEQNVALFSMLGVELDDGIKEVLKQQNQAAVVDDKPCAVMPLKATPYRHQVAAFNFALRLFGGVDGS
jgi:hypothetical protein